MLLLIALGIGSVIYANNELKLLTDSLRRVIDEKHVFIKEKEDRINRIKCMLRSPGLTLEGEYRINLRLYGLQTRCSGILKLQHLGRQYIILTNRRKSR